MNETREEKRWAIGQRRRVTMETGMEYEGVLAPRDPEYCGGTYPFMLVDLVGYSGRLGVDPSFPSTLISDAPEAQPEKPMRSGPVVVEWKVGQRREVTSPKTGSRYRGVLRPAGSRMPCVVAHTFILDDIEGLHSADNYLGVDESWPSTLLADAPTPTQQPSPSHVCKDVRCGTNSGPSATGIRTTSGAWYCSARCHDEVEGATQSGGEAAQRHRQPISAAPAEKTFSQADLARELERRTTAPSPAPWRCADVNCKTPTAGPHKGQHRLMWGICVGCAEGVTPAVKYKRPSRQEAVATLGAFHVPGSVPVSPHLEAMGGTVGSSWWPKTVEVTP